MERPRVFGRNKHGRNRRVEPEEPCDCRLLFLRYFGQLAYPDETKSAAYNKKRRKGGLNMRNSLRRKFQGLGVGCVLCFLGYGGYQARLENQATFEAKQQQILPDEESANLGEDTLVAQWLKSQTTANDLNSVGTVPQRTASLYANVTAKYEASMALKKANNATIVSKADESSETKAEDKTPTESTAGTEVKQTEEASKKEPDAVATQPETNPTTEPSLPVPDVEPETPKEPVVEFPLLVNVDGIYLATTAKTETTAKVVHIEQPPTTTANIRYLFTLSETVATLWDSKNWSTQTVVALLEKDGTSTGYQILDSVKATKSQPNATFPVLKMDVETYKTKGITDSDSLSETLLLSYTTDKETTYWVATRLVADGDTEEAPATENSASES